MQAGKTHPATAMDTEMEPQGDRQQRRSIPGELLRSLYSFILLFCVPGAVITFFAPLFTIELSRVNPDRVDATVSKKLLFVVPISRDTATGIVDTELAITGGGTIRRSGSSTSAESSVGKAVGKAEDNGRLLLKGRGGESIEVWISPKDLAAVNEELLQFITAGTEPYLRRRVVSNWKFGVILPGLILALWLVIFVLAMRVLVTGREFDPGAGST